MGILFLSTGCTTASPGENTWTSDQGPVPYHRVVTAYQDRALKNTLDHVGSEDSFEETLDLALEMDAKLTGMIMRGLGEHRIDRAAKRNKKETTTAANDAAQEILVDRINSIVGVLYIQGSITIDDVTTAAKNHELNPAEITKFFSGGFPDAQTIHINHDLGWIIYYLGDSNMDIYKYTNSYEATFYDFYTGALHGKYFDQQRSR